MNVKNGDLEKWLIIAKEIRVKGDIPKRKIVCIKK